MYEFNNDGQITYQNTVDVYALLHSAGIIYDQYRWIQTNLLYSCLHYNAYHRFHENNKPVPLLKDIKRQTIVEIKCQPIAVPRATRWTEDSYQGAGCLMKRRLRNRARDVTRESIMSNKQGLKESIRRPLHNRLIATTIRWHTTNIRWPVWYEHGP